MTIPSGVPITIEPADNGFVVRAGSATFVFEGTERLRCELVNWLANASFVSMENRLNRLSRAFLRGQPFQKPLDTDEKPA